MTNMMTMMRMTNMMIMIVVMTTIKHSNLVFTGLTGLLGNDLVSLDNSYNDYTIVRRIRTVATADNELRVMLYKDGVIASA